MIKVAVIIADVIMLAIDYSREKSISRLDGK